jgi:hypothetical protein
LAWCRRAWTFGLAATVWVVVVWLVGLGVEDDEEEDPQPAATAAITSVARESLSRVIVLKDAGFVRLLPGNATRRL